METKPIRIQRKRTKGWRMPPNTVYVGRPTTWGNPYTVESYCPDVSPVLLHPVTLHLARQAYVERFEDEMNDLERLLAKRLLAGKNLACWCPLDQPCHADVLLRIANK